MNKTEIDDILETQVAPEFQLLQATFAFIGKIWRIALPWHPEDSLYLKGYLEPIHLTRQPQMSTELHKLRGKLVIWPSSKTSFPFTL